MHGATLVIAGRAVGPGSPVYIVAELSANHRQDKAEALRLIRAAKEAGADAIKLQTYTPDTMTIQASGGDFEIRDGIWKGRTLYDLYAEAYTPWEWHQDLKREADRLNIHLFSTPFDPTAVDFLDDLGVPAYKVASFELVDVPLLRHIARKGRPIIVSTGMATLAEIDEAATAIRGEGNEQFAFMHCISAYPALPEEMNLRTIPNLAETFNVPVGLSDHTLGMAITLGAVALGACLVEKHLTFDRAAGGPDAAFSLEPGEFGQMIQSVRQLERALGSVRYGPTEREKEMRSLRRSLFAVTDVAAGEVLTTRNVRSIRPATGLHPRYLTAVLGRRAARGIPSGTPLSWHLITDDE